MSLTGGLEIRGGHFHFAKVHFVYGVLSSVFPSTLVALLAFNKFPRRLLAAVFLALFFCEMWIFLSLGTRVTDRIIMLIDQTNRVETAEFFQQYLPTWPTLFAALGVVVLVVAYKIAARWWAKVRAASSPRWFAPGAIVINILSALALVNCPMGWWGQSFRSLPTPFKLASSITLLDSKSDVLSQTEEALSLVDSRMPMDGDAPQTLVWVIGESFNRRHSSLYGYSLDTNPGLRRELEAGNLLVFDDVVTPSSGTVNVINALFTTPVVKDKDKMWRAPLLPTLLHHAGYTVTVHDNHSTQNGAEGFWDDDLLYFLSSRGVSQSSLDYRNDRLEQYDMEFCRNEIDSMRRYAFGAPHAMSVFHLQGQHIPAYKRFPAELGKFSPASDYDWRPDLDTGQKEDLAAYDNATLYNDSVVTMIVSSLRGRDAVMVYHTDHGEEIHDYRHQYGRTLEPLTRGIVDNIFRIPMVIFTTPEFRERHPAKYRAMVEASHKPITLAAMSQLLMGISGIETEFLRAEDNPLSRDYRPAGKRLMNDSIDYDVFKTRP